MFSLGLIWCQFSPDILFLSYTLSLTSDNLALVLAHESIMQLVYLGQSVRSLLEMLNE